MDSKIKDNKLVLIPGVTGKMGEEFKNRFKELNGFDVVGFSSSKENSSESIIKCDFLDKNSINRAISKLSFDDYSEVFLIHSIGSFIFEEEDMDDIDELRKEVYKSNFITFKNFAEELTKKINLHKNHLIIVAFGSISDRYDVPYWSTYSRAKIKLKNYIREMIDLNTRGVFINVSSTEKDDERVYADKTYWLSCKEISNKSMPSILNKELNWQEIDIFKINPDYYPDYFKDHNYIKEKWLKDMYGA